MPERTDWSALDDTLTRLLQEPSYASQILTTTAGILADDSFLTLNAWTLNDAITAAASQVTSGLPPAVASEALTAARLALPHFHRGETCGEYALRLRPAAWSIR